MLLLTMRVHDHDIIQRMLHHSTHQHRQDNENEQQPQTFMTVEGQNFATQFSDDTTTGAKRLRSIEQLTPPPFPRHSMLARRRVSWCCEISSLRTASVRRPDKRPTLNFWGKGCVQKQLHTRNAQILVLRTFVLQQSLKIGSSID